MKKEKQNNFFYDTIKFIIVNIKQIDYIFYMSFPLIAMDFITRLFGHKIDYYFTFGTAPNLFTLSWIILFISISLLFKKKIGKYIYLTVNLFFLLMFLVNNIYYSMTNTFFDFILLESASEGSAYILDTIKNANILIYISAGFIIFLIYKGYKKIPYKTKSNLKPLLFVFIYFIVLHSIATFSLGKAFNTLEWSTWLNPKNNYIAFNDNNKSMKISGLYEYTIRGFYITYLKTDEVQKEEDKIFLDEAYKNNAEHKNKYTGIFEGKNLILIQLEGIDDWIITKEDTPTLYKMMNNSINFKDHYSYYNGGGSTFNSEFAVNTGFITPLSYTQNAYTFNKNAFPDSLANIFKSDGYTVNAFHMNTGEYYSRTTNYKNWGYDNYYGLKDINEYEEEDNTYMLDRELILDETFNELMFPTNTKFVNYLITYSLHLPFTNTNGVCKLLYNMDNLDNEENEFRQMTEIECIKKQAKETDYMMELLLQQLEEKGLINDTVIVAFADHYLYTISNQNILSLYKKTNNNLINHTPFFIWSNDIKKTTVSKTTSQLNIFQQY